ncbi:MAG: hypothetical protein R6T85_04580 [Egibacteraceae bacterium]
MHKLLVSFLIVFVGASILAAIMQGGGGIVSTVLTADIDADGTTIPVTSTSLFMDADVIRIGNEKILYTSITDTSFDGVTRGYDGTLAEEHEAGARVYTVEAGVLNDAMGYNLGVSIETSGMWGLVMLPINFFTKTLPHLVKLNVNFLATPEHRRLRPDLPGNHQCGHQ